MLVTVPVCTPAATLPPYWRLTKTTRSRSFPWLVSATFRPQRQKFTWIREFHGMVGSPPVNQSHLLQKDLKKGRNGSFGVHYYSSVVLAFTATLPAGKDEGAVLRLQRPWRSSGHQHHQRHQPPSPTWHFLEQGCEVDSQNFYRKWSYGWQKNCWTWVISDNFWQYLYFSESIP